MISGGEERQNPGEGMGSNGLFLRVKIC